MRFIIKDGMLWCYNPSIKMWGLVCEVEKDIPDTEDPKAIQEYFNTHPPNHEPIRVQR